MCKVFTVKLFLMARDWKLTPQLPPREDWLNKLEYIQ